jgi:hypothetical protein
MHQGSCLCGAVAYEISAPLGTMIYCHCQRCRKAGGSAFATNVIVPAEGFRYTRGEAVLKSYRTEAGVHRMFCTECGSAILSKRESMPEIVRVRVGTFDTPLQASPSAHIFVGSKAEWHEIRDDLPQHAERAPA